MEHPFVMVMRKNEIEHVWQFLIKQHGFDVVLYCRGTESEVVKYINSEFPHEDGYHHAISEDEVDMVGKLYIPVYIAPVI